MRLPSLLLAVLVPVVEVASAGCAAPNDDELVDTASSEIRHIPHPSGAYEAKVTANGSGCPAGTWDAALSSDGETFTVRFNSYEATVSPGVALSEKNCNIDISLGSRQGTQFAVGSFHYQGYVFLEKSGMRARQRTKYKFAELRERDADRDEVQGPADTSYLFSHDVAAPEQEWTRCRRNDTFRIKTNLVMKNDRSSTGEGYINSLSVDGTLSYRWAMKWRRCPL